MFKVNIAQDPHDTKVRWLQTTHDGHAYSLIEFRSDEEALQIIRALQQSVQPTPESGRDLPAESSDSKGSAPAESG